MRAKSWLTFWFIVKIFCDSKSASITHWDWAQKPQKCLLGSAFSLWRANKVSEINHINYTCTMFTNSWWLLMLLSSCCLAADVRGSSSSRVGSSKEFAASDIFVQIGGIPQPFNCSLFLDNLEVRNTHFLDITKFSNFFLAPGNNVEISVFT